MAVIAILRSRTSALTLLLALFAMAGAPLPAYAARADDPNKLKVLILGDSLALCGFGKRLDERFRSDPKCRADAHLHGLRNEPAQLDESRSRIRR
jgi:hypothetical protein